MENNDTISNEALEAEIVEDVKARQRAVIVHGLKKFTLQVSLSVAAGLASHFILKALTPKEEIEIVEEFEVIEEITE